MKGFRDVECIINKRVPRYEIYERTPRELKHEITAARYGTATGEWTP
jgi:hypothetical protein